MNRINLLMALVLSLPLAPLHAELPSTIQPERVVGSVYGKAITAADIGLSEPIDPSVVFDARDGQRWEMMGHIMQAFGKPISDRFVQEQKIDVTDEEVSAYRNALGERRQTHLHETEERIVNLKEELARPNLSSDEKTKLEKEKAMLAFLLPRFREAADNEVPADISQVTIKGRKLEQALQKTFGGRVIFQQAGPEALDARRTLFEEAEKRGDIRFEDAGVRHLFYYYFNMNHVVVDERLLEQELLAANVQVTNGSIQPEVPRRGLQVSPPAEISQEKPLQVEKAWVILESSVERLELVPNKIVPVDSGVWFGGRQPGNGSSPLGFLDLTEGHVTLLLEAGSAIWDAVGKEALALQFDRKSLVKLSAADKSVVTWDKRPEDCQFFSQVVAFENHFCISSPYNPLWIFDTWLHAWQTIELKRVSDSESERFEQSSPTYYRPSIKRFIVGPAGEFWAFQGTHDATRGNAVSHYNPRRGSWEHFGFPWAMARGDDHFPIGVTDNYVWFAGRNDTLLFDKNSQRWSTAPVSWPGNRSYHSATFTQKGMLYPLGNTVKKLASDLSTWEDFVSIADDENITALAVSGNSLILATSTGIHVLNKLDTGQYSEPKHYPWKLARDAKAYNAVFGLASQNQALALLDDLCKAATEGDLERVTSLLAGNVDVEATTDPNGLTPLMLASRAGHLKVAKLLLENGADINARTRFRQDALTMAAQGGHRELADFLLSKGATR